MNSELVSEKRPAGVNVTISPPKLSTVKYKIIGESPYMQLRFSEKAKHKMMATQMAGSTNKKGAKREPRDFDGDYQGAMHKSMDGWVGIPASAFRNACIDACRMVGFKMTHAKMSIFILPDGFDAIDGQPLVRIYGEPEKTIMPVPNANGAMDLRVRPMWRAWHAEVRVRFDADQFTLADVTNLLARAGLQVGVGEGRPFSKNSNGMGFGIFNLGEGQC